MTARKRLNICPRCKWPRYPVHAPWGEVFWVSHDGRRRCGGR